MHPADFYPYLKLLHVTTVIITGSLFMLRFILMLRGRLLQQGAWVRKLPLYNDTLLLLSGLSMAWIQGLLPQPAPWLGTKLGILLAHILLGSVALWRGHRAWVRSATGVAAIGCYFYIISVALSRDPTPSLEALISRFGFA